MAESADLQPWPRVGETWAPALPWPREECPAGFYTFSYSTELVGGRYRLEFEPEEGALLEDHDGAPVPAAPVWPGCLAWPDRTVVEVKAWTADPDAPLPEVLRWRETDGTAERWEPVDVD